MLFVKVSAALTWLTFNIIKNEHLKREKNLRILNLTREQMKARTRPLREERQK